MEESKKGVTPTLEVKKPDSSMDIDGFGKDFLTSWKLTTEEKNGLDFTNKTPQKVTKKGFDFAKLDDFELGDDFAKISSFKMDISDIDFSSPEGATDKPREKPKGESIPRKISSEQDAFSFNFDFNELEGFGLESNLLNVEKDSETKNKGLGLSSKNEEKVDSGRKPDTSDPDATVIGSKKSAESNEVANSESRFVDIPCSLVKETTAEKNNEAEGNENGEHKKEFQLSRLKNGCTKTYSGDRHEKQIEPTNSEKQCVNAGSEILTLQHGNKIVPETSDDSLSDNQKDSEKSTSTGSKGSGSTLHMSDLECSSRVCIEKSECDANDRSNTKLESDITSRSRIKQLGKEKTAMEDSQVNGASSMIGVFSKLDHGSKRNAQNRVSHPSLSSSSNFAICRASTVENLEPKNLKGNALQLNAKGGALQLKPAFKPEATDSNHSPLSLSKAVRAFSGLKMEKLTSCPADENRVSGSNAKETLPNISISMSPSGEVQRQLLLGSQNHRIQENNPCVPEEGSSCGIKQTVIPKTGFTNNRLFKISSFEKHESSVNVDKKCLETKRMIPRLKESNSNLVITRKPESYPRGCCNLKSETTSASTSTSSASGKKCSSLNSSLKRKSVEVPNMEVSSLNPLKRPSGSMFQRKLLVATPISENRRNDKQTINEREVLRASNEEQCSKDLSLGLQSSTDAPTAEHMKDKEDSPLMENDEYRKKAESYAKELDDICSMLKKKNEEAKELLVHAVVNNNSLLMLNHPMYDEKIRSLQRFANSLLATKYEV